MAYVFVSLEFGLQGRHFCTPRYMAERKRMTCDDELDMIKKKGKGLFLLSFLVWIESFFSGRKPCLSLLTVLAKKNYSFVIPVSEFGFGWFYFIFIQSAAQWMLLFSPIPWSFLYFPNSECEGSERKESVFGKGSVYFYMWGLGILNCGVRCFLM